MAAYGYGDSGVDWSDSNQNGYCVYDCEGNDDCDGDWDRDPEDDGQDAKDHEDDDEMLRMPYK